MSSAARPERPALPLALSALLVALVSAPVTAQLVTVTNLADGGPGSLREAIDTANSDGVPTTITFAPGLAGGTVALASELPPLNEPGTTIDGDLDDDCVPDIGLDGAHALGSGIGIWGDSSIVRGLAVFRFTWTGIDINSSGNEVECNYVGLDLARSPAGNGYNGVRIAGDASDNRTGPGNVIAHNASVGVRVRSNTLPGYPDFTALTPDATLVFPTLDFTDDCSTTRAFHRVGDPPPTDGSGRPFTDQFGMRLTGTLHLTAAGTMTFDFPELDDVVRLDIDGGPIELDWPGGGTPPPTEVALGEGDHTIRIDFAEYDGAAGLRLVIYGPGSASLWTGASPPAGCGSFESGLCGELFQLGQVPLRNRITQNSIYDNGYLGIDLTDSCGDPINDPGDADYGPNELLNFPVIGTVLPIGGGLYSTTGTAPPDAIVELFVSDGNPSGFGEGRKYLDSTTADGSGTFSKGLLLEPGDSPLTATATDPAGNTSEFGPNFAPGAGQELATVDSTISGLPGATIEIPVYARDAMLTPLGIDRPAGERIQSLAYKVTFTPAASVASKLFSRAGITAALAPIFEGTPTTSTTASYIGTFDETTNPIPFTLDGGAPGDQVLKIVVSISPAAPAGTIALTLDPATTELANQAGTLAENSGNGWLALVDGAITVLSNAARALRSYALSSSEIQLSWDDPNANETGFRLERSTDGASWSTVATLGPDDTSHLDATGLAPATLYYHRLVTLTPADGHVSNLAAVSTFPAAAAKVCAEPVATPARSFAVTPSVAWSGSAWGVAWLGREGAIQDEIWFQRFHATTLAPLGPPTRVAASASAADRVRADRPVLAWSDGGGGHWGVAWTEGLPGEPGTPLVNTTFFSLLAPDGSIERGGVRISNETNDHPWEDGLPAPLAWDGTHWGIFELTYVSQPMLDLVYRRLDEDGDVVLGPVTVLAPPDAHVSDVAAAWNPAASKYGVFWHEIRDQEVDLYFQVMEESTGALEGSATHLDDYLSAVGTYGGTVIADGSGFAVAWVDVEIDVEGNDLGVSWMRRFDAAGAPLGPALRLSDDPVADGAVFHLARKPAGGFAVFGYCGATPTQEICRFETDASGARIGGLTEVTPADGAHSRFPDVTSNGTDFFVAFEDRGAEARDLAASLVPVADFSLPGLVVPLSAGHDSPSDTLCCTNTVALGAGFAATWVDTTGGVARIHARTWDGAGSQIADLSPLDPTPTLVGRPGAVGVGDTFAVAFRDETSDDLWFARYDATGSAVVGRTSVSTLPGFRASVSMAFSGESYGLLWSRNGGNGLAFLRVAPDGTPQGSEVLLPIGNPTNTVPQIVWTGFGWAIAWVETLWPAPAWSLQYALLAADGSLLVDERSLANIPQPAILPQFHLLWNGTDLYLAWSALGELDPPLDEIYFVRINLDGTPAFAPVTAVSTPLRDLGPWLYWTPSDARLHLLHQPGGSVGEREVELEADGTLLPGERWWSNRTAGAVAWNGVTLGYLHYDDGNLFFETGECVTGDATPPPCPDLTVGSFDELVRLDWSGVSDPESGVHRYRVFRDGLPLGKTWADATQLDDGGFAIGATHLYEVRALNAAWNESDGCGAVSFSTTPGDANGDGSYSVADIFYLINFFFADGPPPAGNADANGDNAVTVTDIFYMINNLFSGGPPPAALWPGTPTLSSVRELPFGEASSPTPSVAPSSRRRSRLVVGNGTVAPGGTARIPILLADLPGTPLGPDRPYGERIQALALAVRCAPCDGIASLAIEPAGALLEETPFFETRPSGSDQAALLVTYDEAASPLFFARAPSRLLQRVATLVVQVSPSAPSGAALDLRLDPGTTMLSNQSGTIVESAPNGWLELGDGRLRIVARPTVDVP